MENNDIKMIILGDTLLGGIYLEEKNKEGLKWRSDFNEVAKIIKQCDLVFFNLEGPFYSDGEKSIDKTSIISNDQRILNLFKGCKNKVACLANNHIMDYGENGLKKTIEILKENGFGFTGAGTDIKKAKEPYILKINDKSIAFISYTNDDPWVGSIIAGDSNAGCAPLKIGEEHEALENIRMLKNNSDFVCVSVHCGKEYYIYPDPGIIKLFRKIVSAGSDMVIGHHPHVAQGVEIYKGKPICYSLGNFFMPYIRGEEGRIYIRPGISNKSMYALFDLKDNGNIKCDILGGKVNKNYKIKVFSGRKSRSFIRYIKKISEPINSDKYKEFYENYSNSAERKIGMFCLYKVFYNLFHTPIDEIIRTVKISDFKRLFMNIRRSLKI